MTRDSLGGHRITLCFLLLVLGALAARADSIEAQIAAHFSTGAEAARSGHFAKAVEEYKEVLRLDPTLAEARLNLGLAYHSVGEYKLAVTEFAKALNEKSDIPGANLFLGIDYLKIGAASKAIAPLQNALRAQPSSREARRALAACYIDEENYRLAQEQFRMLASSQFDKAEALYVRGRGYVDLAKHLADRMSREHQNTSWADRLAGDLLADSSGWTDAGSLYRQALTLDPSQPDLHVSLGAVYLEQEKTEAAQSAFHDALRLDPYNLLALLGLVQVDLMKGRAAAGLEGLNKIWSVFPPFLSRAVAFPAIRQDSAKAQSLAAAIEPLPISPPKEFLLFRVYQSGGDDSAARAHQAAFEQEVSAWSKSHETRTQGSGDPCKLHDYSSCARQLLAQKSNSPSKRSILGESLFALGDYSQAAEIFGGILSEDKNSVPARYWLARSYKRLADDTLRAAG